MMHRQAGLAAMFAANQHCNHTGHWQAILDSGNRQGPGLSISTALAPTFSVRPLDSLPGHWGADQTKDQPNIWQHRHLVLIDLLESLVKMVDRKPSGAFAH